MTVKIQEKEIELKLSIRTYIYYENIINKSFELKDLSNFNNLVSFFYSVILSSSKKQGLNFKMAYDDFIEWIDDNGGEYLLVDFINWFTKEQESQAQFLRKNETENTEGNKKKLKA